MKNNFYYDKSNKKTIIVANWKLNGDKKLLDNLYYKININKELLDNKILLISPPMIYLDYSYLLFKENKNIYICSQNIDINYSGSYTGETSVYMLKDIGVNYTIIGHSERRIFHKESNKNILKKIIISKLNNLTPILCIGESEKDFNNKKSLEKCIYQIKYLIKFSNINILDNIIIAYEPIWSIGTSINANEDHINYITENILKYVNKYNTNLVNKINILYGGSISLNNLQILKNCKYINGFLIGKTSLDLDKFIKILKII